jgi:predicted flap endonuclease-1-like 5' DNA nuclease
MEKPAFPTADTQKMLTLPMGAISPLWLMFAGAATVGAAYFWSRTFFKPTNLEALTALPETAIEVTTDVAEAAVETVEVAAEAVVDVVEAEVEFVAETVETIAAAPEPVAIAVEAVVEAAPAPVKPDDLTVLTGIGPKLAAALAERGVTRFAQIAAWTEEEIAGFDKDLKLMGRIGREAWIAQATRLAGK